MTVNTLDEGVASDGYDFETTNQLLPIGVGWNITVPDLNSQTSGKLL